MVILVVQQHQLVRNSNVEILGSDFHQKLNVRTLNISEDGVSSENNLQISIQGNRFNGYGDVSRWF